MGYLAPSTLAPPECFGSFYGRLERLLSAGLEGIEHLPIHAAMKADALLEKGDLDGQRVWLRIVKTIEALLETQPGDGAAMH